jgi:hypothetical protein
MPHKILKPCKQLISPEHLHFKCQSARAVYRLPTFRYLGLRRITMIRTVERGFAFETVEVQERMKMHFKQWNQEWANAEMLLTGNLR